MSNKGKLASHNDNAGFLCAINSIKFKIKMRYPAMIIATINYRLYIWPRIAIENRVPHTMWRWSYEQMWSKWHQYVEFIKVLVCYWPSKLNSTQLKNPSRCHGDFLGACTLAPLALALGSIVVFRALDVDCTHLVGSTVSPQVLCPLRLFVFYFVCFLVSTSRSVLFRGTHFSVSVFICFTIILGFW